MSLIIPGVGTEAGPTYAFDVNASLILLDQHDHSLGRGVQITPAGLNINAQLDMQENDLINVNTLGFSAQDSASTLIQSLSVAPGGGTGLQDLWFTDGVGNQIQITKSGIVNVVASSIPGESYAGGTFIWDQTQDGAPTTPANFDIGSITLRPNTAATTYGVTLSPPSAIASSYTLLLPNNPSLLAGTAFLTLSTAGDIVGSIQTSLGITAANLAPDSVTTTKILNGAVTAAKLASGVLPVMNSQSFTASGSFVVPSGVSVLQVLCIGGGGGGGGGGRNATPSSGSGGGGTIPQTTILTGVSGLTLTVTIGAAGTGAGQQGSSGANGNNGTAGGTSSVTNAGATLIRCAGGDPGLGAVGGVGGVATATSWTPTRYTVGGGAGAANANNGSAGTDNFYGIGGAGGVTAGGNPGGGGGGGGLFDGAAAGSAGNVKTGNGAGGFGCGGGGGAGGSTSGGNNGGAGGAGSPGLVIITWVSPP